MAQNPMLNIDNLLIGQEPSMKAKLETKLREAFLKKKIAMKMNSEIKIHEEELALAKSIKNNAN